MKRTYTILSTLLLAFLLTVPTFAQEATQAAEPVPTVETVATEIAPPVSEPAAMTGFFTALVNSDIIWQMLMGFALLLLFRSVPQSTIDKLKADAAKTDTPVDDLGARLLELLNANPSLIPDFLKRGNQPTTTVNTSSNTTTTIDPTNTTITVSAPNPVPTAPTLQPQPTLSDELDKLKNAPAIIVQPLNVPINPNSTLKAFKATEWAGGRAKDVPDTFDVVWQPFKADDPYAAPPELHTKDDGLRAEASHRRGRLLFGQRLPVIIPTQRYLLKARFACDLKLKPDMKALAGMIAVHGQLLSDGAVLRQLDAWSPQTVEDATGDFEALWVFEFGRKLPNIEYMIEVRIGTLDSVPFADQSHITIQGIEVLPVAAGYGFEGVYRV